MSKKVKKNLGVTSMTISQLELLRQRENKNNITTDPKFELFLDACINGNKKDFDKYFCFDFVNKQNRNGGTALMQTAVYGHTDLTKYIIEAGADLEIKTTSSNTALMRAVHHGEVEIVKILLDSGANVDHINSLGFSVFDIVEQNIAENIVPRNGDGQAYERIYALLNEYRRDK